MKEKANISEKKFAENAKISYFLKKMLTFMKNVMKMLNFRKKVMKMLTMLLLIKHNLGVEKR